MGDDRLTPYVQVSWSGGGSVCRSLVVDQVAVDVVLQDEARWIEPGWLATVQGEWSVEKTHQ